MKGVRYIIGCLLVGLASCQQHETVELTEEPVSLTFKLDLVDKDSRGLADGDYLDVVSVYLVDANKTIVASQENIEVLDEATELEVKFERSDNLKRGIHTLMAVANHETLSSFGSDSYNELMANEVHATRNTGNVSPKDIVQPLSLMKEIELHAGHNEVEGELQRTFARLRIEVRNNSGSMPLKINSLTFSENFTQKQAYVFDDGTDRKYSFETGAPVSTSEHAREPFVQQTIEAQESSVVFDGYLLESKAAEGERYTYTLDFDYDDTPNITDQIFLNITGIENHYEDYYFLIQNNRSSRFIKDSNTDNAKLVQGDASIDFLKTNVAQNASKDYLWKLEWVSEDTYRIKNVATGRYIGQPDGGSVPMVGAPGNHTYRFYNYRDNANDANSTGVQLGYGGNANGRILNDWEAKGEVIGGYNRNDGGNPFKFHLVEKSIKYDQPIVLTTINPITQQSSPVTAIKRNDFINVLITISYNPVAGTFEFVVEGWKSYTGNVEFN